MAKKEKLVEEMENVSKVDVFLVEFKAPRELVEMFDAKLRSRFASRSEALRMLMRRFLDENY